MLKAKDSGRKKEMRREEKGREEISSHSLKETMWDPSVSDNPCHSPLHRWKEQAEKNRQIHVKTQHIKKEKVWTMKIFSQKESPLIPRLKKKVLDLRESQGK